MYFLVTTHRVPRFYKNDSDPVEVVEPMNDFMQAVSVLYRHGIQGYKSKRFAKEKAKELGLATWKYLKID
jgi:hypothetical protein